MKKFNYIFIFILFAFSLSFAQDKYEEKIVGDGFKYISIYKMSGPFNIKVLEIDLTKDKIKIEPVLAADGLGKGYEKTSLMSQRKNKSRHIVIGAINADFFGNNQPTNSMIIDKKYAKGVWTNRSLFGMKEMNKPFIGIHSFTGKVFLKNDTLTINGCNSTRQENYLMLYTDYMGTNTQTNQWGSEIRITPIENFNINRNIRYKVTQKDSWKGAMSLTNNSYVLSAHGKNQKMLDSLINLGDTITVNIGTNPEIANILQMLGGGPRLLTDGKKPGSYVNLEGFDQSFVESRHPRSAVGISKDSSKVYFVTVDGRQTGFSVGMSLNELADFLISIGSSEAMNLDGGGSTTMVIRNQIVNSPSDLGGERAVANALLAVSEAETDKIAKSISIKPDQFTIDSGQTKLLEVTGKDNWDYDIPIDISLISWTFSGISGVVDSNGFFIPKSIGSGKIIGKLGNYFDTVYVTVNPLAQNKITWELSAANGLLPNWFSSDGNTERGIAYSRKSSEEHRLYAVSRKTGAEIVVLNALNGDFVAKLKTEGITGGIYLLNDIECSSDSKIFACNLTIDSKTNAFKVYKWNSETENPQTVIEYSTESMRLGDKFTLIGSVSDNTAKVYAAAANNNKVLLWEMSNGTFSQVPKVITLSDVSNVGINPSIAPSGVGNSRFIINASSITPREYDETGKNYGVVDTSIVPLNSNAIRYFEAGSKKYIITYISGAGNEYAAVVDVTAGLDKAAKTQKTNILGSNTNANYAGDVAVRSHNGTYIFYVLGTNNGLGAYEFSAPVTAVEQEKEYLPDSRNYKLFQNYPNPFNPATTISYFVPQKMNVKIKIYDVLGRIVDEFSEGVKSAGMHSVIWNAKNMTSGVYYYKLIFENGYPSEVKKMMLLR